jgi:YfiH family protein
MGVSREQLVRMQQVHGRAVAVANPALDPPVADVIVTHDPAVVIAVQSADCVPLLLADTRSGAVAAAHAGWRGLAARVPQAAVEAMMTTFGSRAEDLLVAAGPSIGACCYEVGVDVRDRFRDAGFSPEALDRWFSGSPQTIAGNPSSRSIPQTPRPEHWYFDGWSSTRDQLRAAGITPDRFFAAGLCTASHAGALCSYRRDGAPAGRLVGAIRARRP